MKETPEIPFKIETVQLAQTTEWDSAHTLVQFIVRLRQFIRTNVTMPKAGTDLKKWKQHLPRPPLEELKVLFDRGDVYYWTIKVCDFDLDCPAEHFSLCIGSVVREDFE